MNDRTLWILLAAILIGLALKRREPALREEVTSKIEFDFPTPEFIPEFR
jgi:hypothetical protein